MDRSPADDSPLDDVTATFGPDGLARYDRLKRLGSGGMGVVYEAYDNVRRQPIALKTLLHFSPSALYRFKQEFRALADVTHPNLVSLYELVATDPDHVFFTMELVRGVDFISYALAAGKDPGSRALAPTTTMPKPLRAPLSRAANDVVPPSDPPAESDCKADLTRLYPALRQLVEGVNALHAAGKLHRDIKPSNVLVTPEGRVVLLDFGVATDLAYDLDAPDREIVGTARYMAPEQATDSPSTPASDWYSVGVVLYEALVGHPPFGGSAADVLASKAVVEPPPPSRYVKGIPEDLDTLCCALLRRDADARPTGRDIVRCLDGGGVYARSTPLPALSTGSDGAPIGRDVEHAALRDALEAARAGRLVTVKLHGPSGMGRSTLAAHFVDGLVEREEAVVLHGRAYERESVPYKALDSVIDELSRHLMRHSETELAALLPTGVGALARLFPVLRRVDAIAAAAEPPGAAPQTVRRRAIDALHELLVKLASRRPVVLCIDDAQWGDVDSAALLIEVARRPFASPVVLLLSHRDEDAEASPFLTDLRTRWPLGTDVRDVALSPLRHEDACTLALSRLASRDPAAIEAAEAIAREAGGSPLLIDELARSTDRARLRAGGVMAIAATHAPRLEQVIEERMARLPRDARRLLEVVAVSARPLPLTILGDAAKVYDRLDEMVAKLRAERFVRTGMRDGREVAEMIHDRLRETVTAQLSESALREHHGRLARVLESVPAADGEALAVHLLGAGEDARAARHAERAAEQAATKLAFVQAIRLYRLALATIDEGSVEARRLRVCLAHVLEGAGRGADAAQVYVEAAASARGFERMELERAAAEQLLTSGHVDEGADALHRILRAAGMRGPRTIAGALLWGLAYRLALRVLGMRFRERDARDVARVDHVRIEALYAVVIGLSFVHVVYGMGVQARHLLLSLRRGDRFQILRAAGTEALNMAARGGSESERERTLGTIVQRLADGSDDRDWQAFSSATEAIRWFLRGRWSEAARQLDFLRDEFPTNRAGWHSNAHLFSIWALGFVGRMADLRRRHAARLADT
ncbi:MAG TPA: protein kinase, partial [Polyangiaceae bacterium]|nr:protein kinase [Polyangiaceae bacterium]